MKRRLLAAFVAALMALALIPASIAEGEFSAPKGYNEYDHAMLMGFLTAPSAVEGKVNGQMLDPYFDPADPSTYSHDPDYGDSNTFSIEWVKDEDGEFRLYSIDIRNKHGLAGALDLSGCGMLCAVSLYDLPCLTGLVLDSCASLETLYCRECGAEAVSAEGCSRLAYVYCGGAALKRIILAGAAPSVESVLATVGGAVGASLDPGAELLAAQADEGYSFIGWYVNGELVSEDEVIDVLDYGQGVEATAVFASSSQSPAGDMDGNGELSFTDVSVLYSMLLSSNASLIPAQTADVNGDGIVGFTDVSALYCRVLGA